MKINSLSPASSPIIIIIMFIPSVKRYDYLPLKVKYKTIISVKELEVEHNLLKRLTVFQMFATDICYIIAETGGDVIIILKHYHDILI